MAITVNYSVAGGSPAYRASGWIYGMTETADAPPDAFLTDVRYRWMRAGGAQLDSPGGWVSGGYERRWDATRAQLLRTRALGGQFVLLVHDLWGADGTPIDRFPGDGDDWSDYDAFLARLIDDVRATGAPVQWDIWNEPDLNMFWNRPTSQYLRMWRRAHRRIRAALPDHLIVGPSCACTPSGGGWWVRYLDFVDANGVVPDVISWHALPGDPVSDAAAADETLDARGIPHPRPYQINEYGASDEQHPAGAAWYIARLERAGVDGLRANWASGPDLHDNLASLLVRDAAGGYRPRGEWWVYQFYGSQTGQAVSVTAGSTCDAFATAAAGSAKILIGGVGTAGAITVDIRRLDATSGIVRDGRVRVVVRRIPHDDGRPVAGPITVEDRVATLADNATTVTLPPPTVNDATTATLPPTPTASDAFTVTLLPPPADSD